MSTGKSTMTISFDKRLAELDAYLQMLIEQAEYLDEKLDKVSSDEKGGILLIKNNLETLLGSLKHAIVLLQIAKVSIKTSLNTYPSSSLTSLISPASNNKSIASNTTVPITVNLQEQQRQLNQFTPQPPARASRKSTPQLSKQISSSPKLQTSASPRQQNHQFSAPKRALSAQESCRKNDSPPQCNNPIFQFPEGCTQKSDQLVKGTLSSVSPELINGIYNDDDDDDDAFYDAAGEQQANTPKLNTTIDKNIDNTPTQVLERSLESSINMSNDKKPIEDESIDWDALYDEGEEDLGSLENQGSVIKHLMSQIRIGMDLTKVVLPTFILERRSLLEMYADFFAHPDLFSSIPNYDTPEERMIQLVKWFLSAFHAGRKSAVAKKPYNPILGEIFLCHWNLNDEISITSEQKQSSDQNTDGSGDSSSSINNKLLFVAEQVSHHPPVSAFYAENSEKSISCCAHIYTKSKYLGLSVGVHNIGQGVIHLPKHNETYVCTFPSAYGRSILTVPWIELGGSVTITCQQSGYSSNIEFITKPFYGGKKHRIMGEILRPNKEPLMTIEGEWNGCMNYKSPPNSNEKHIFVDTTCLPVIEKQVRSISSQESFESRNVWKEVTRALKLHDVTSATAAKSFIEQRQRDLLKDRVEKGVKWQTRYFEATDDGWNFARSLADIDL